MTTAELIKSAQFITDAEGNKTAVVLDISVWEEIVLALKSAGQLEEFNNLDLELAEWDVLSNEA
ncbi:MAG: hypothetical protein KDJ65_40585, partial [Anaerolineae bacterium]|nr:hypothetical protein [Anaerolineae bacterium]